MKQYKHSYVPEQLYEQVLTYSQIDFFKKLFSKFNSKTHDVLFESLLHMQASLDIHDQVDLTFKEDSKGRNFSNQLQVLVGDYHSSYFYNLLSQHNLLDELYHFIQAIKKINECKMSVLHNDKALSLEELIKQVEYIHTGLFDATNDICKVDHYEEQLKPRLIKQLVYSKDNFWLSILKEQFSQEFKRVFDARINYWELYHFIN
ncbi:heptaprenyl diphosphate synthase component 1 [Aquisalibacillus elongatus]|nr:heptaprenyl diphosphate synthase component 1 [Aquisalibacillus elongatus]